MDSRSLLRENDLNGFEEGLALSKSSRHTDLGQRPNRRNTLSFFFPLQVFEGFDWALYSRDEWSLAPLMVVAIE